MRNLTKFCQISRIERMSSRDGYQQNGNFDENDEFDEISPKIYIRGNELEISRLEPISPDSSKIAAWPVSLERMSSREGHELFLASILTNLVSSARMTNLTKFCQKSRLEPNSPDSSKSPLCQCPSLELIRYNLDLRRKKYRQIRHCRQIRRNHRFFSALLSSSFAIISSFLLNSPDSPNLTNPANLARVTNLTKFRQRSRLEPNSPDSSKSPLCRCPSLELIRSNLGFWRNIVKIAKFP